MKLIKIESNPDVYVNADAIREIWENAGMVQIKFTEGTAANYNIKIDKLLKLIKAAK